MNVYSKFIKSLKLADVTSSDSIKSCISKLEACPNCNCKEQMNDQTIIDIVKNNWDQNKQNFMLDTDIANPNEQVQPSMDGEGCDTCGKNKFRKMNVCPHCNQQMQDTEQPNVKFLDQFDMVSTTEEEIEVSDDDILKELSTINNFIPCP